MELSRARRLWRYRRRTLITASGMALAMGLVIFWVSLSDFGSLFQALASDALQQLGEFAETR